MSIADKLQTIADNTVKIAMPMYYVFNASYMYEDVTFPENTELTIRFLNTPISFQNFATNAVNLKSVKLLADNVTSIGNLTKAFSGISTLETVDFTEYGQTFDNLNSAFLNCSNLKSILGALDMTNCSNCTTWFTGCSKLEDISFVPNTINVAVLFNTNPLLSDASVQSIIDGLVDLTGQSAKNILFHETVGAKLTDEQKATITAKGWNLDY